MGNRWGFRVATSANNEDLHLDRNLSGTPAVCMTWDKTNGNVGIGITSPSYLFDVMGDVADDTALTVARIGVSDSESTAPSLLISGRRDDGTASSRWVQLQGYTYSSDEVVI